MTTDSLEQVPHTAAVAPWSEVFDLTEVVRHRAEFLANELKVGRDDVLTAKLGGTVRFYRAVEAKAFPMLPNCIGNLNAVLDIFCRLATFDNLARAEFAATRKPIFWIRLDEARRERAPALPLDMAAVLCGVEVSFLRASLVPLVKDGALELLRSPDGIAAVLVKSGFINDSSFRRHYRT